MALSFSKNGPLVITVLYNTASLPFPAIHITALKKSVEKKNAFFCSAAYKSLFGD